MPQLLDTDIHQHPMAMAMVLHWLADSHMKARASGEGILVPWVMLGMGLVATQETLTSLPKQKQTLAGWLRTPGARNWRGYTKPIVLAWKDTYWRAFAHGRTAGLVAMKDGRVIATGRTLAPTSDTYAAALRKASRAIGGTIGAEDDDLRIASALGLEFVP